MQQADDFQHRNPVIKLSDLQAGGDTLKRAFPAHPGNLTFMINFPSFFTMVLNMIRAGSGYDFKMVILPQGADMGKHESTAAVFDVSLLPKAIGGGAFSVVDEETGKEEDEACVRGWKHPTVSEFLLALEG